MRINKSRLPVFVIIFMLIGNLTLGWLSNQPGPNTKVDGDYVRIQSDGVSKYPCIGVLKSYTINYSNGISIQAVKNSVGFSLNGNVASLPSEITNGGFISFNGEGADPEGLERLVETNVMIQDCEGGLKVSINSYFLSYGNQYSNYTINNLVYPSVGGNSKVLCDHKDTTFLSVENIDPTLGVDYINVYANPNTIATFYVVDNDIITFKGYIASGDYVSISGFGLVINCGTQLQLLLNE